MMSVATTRAALFAMRRAQPVRRCVGGIQKQQQRLWAPSCRLLSSTAKLADEEEDAPTTTALQASAASRLFEDIWRDFSERSSSFVFPREIIWLGGAPGAGKGTNTRMLMRERGLTTTPIVVSDLLQSPQALEVQRAGGLVSDREVVAALLEELVKPCYASGVVVDGFPRTPAQAVMLRELYDRLFSLYRSEGRTTYPRPIFRICVLFVDKGVSVQRQLDRGKKALERNAQGGDEPVRPTDLDPALAAKRYTSFESTTFAALESLRENFVYNFIDAMGSLERVEQNIQREMQYQSSTELSPEAHDMIHGLPRADEILVHARQNLVDRIDQAEAKTPDTLRAVVAALEKGLYPQIKRHPLAGVIYYRLMPGRPVFENINLAMDVLYDRGFRCILHQTSSMLEVRWHTPRLRSTHT